ncbi:MAG: LamG-like jellyroll fold domain-containing protein [Bacilli bacterium]
MKKGFTLIELLSIIVILGIILAIGIPVVNKVIDNTRQKLYEETAKNIEKATESYVAKNLTMLNSLKNDGDYIEITLKELVDAGVLDNNIQNPITKGMFNLNSYAVRITFQNSNYIYKFNPIYIREGLVADWRFDDFQEPTENFIPNGHFANGQGIPSESGSNPTNEIVLFPENPGDSDWVLRQTGAPTAASTEYEIHFKTGSVLEPDTTYTMSCWVAYTSDWDGQYQIFHSRWYLTDGTAKTTSGSGTLLKTVVIGNLTWEYRYLTFTTESDVNGTFYWYLGYATRNTTGYRYITNVQLEKKPYPTPFVEGIRTGEVKDYSGNNHDATLDLTTTPQWTNIDPEGDGAYYYNGSSNVISTPNFAFETNLSICFWAQPLISEVKEMAIHNVYNNGAFEFYQNGTSVVLRGGATSPSVTGTAALAINEWRYLCATINNTTGKIYRNGVLLSTGTVALPKTLSAPINIGAYNNLQYCFNGIINDFTVYNRTLSDDEILHNFNVSKDKYDL